jgi:zinc and cadmium transporter
MNIVYPIVSVLLVSLLSVVAAIPFLLKKEISKKTLLFLLSISVGVLLSTVFVGFIPEIIEHHYGLDVAIFILIGFLVMFILEKFVHWHHNKCDHKGHNHGEGHSHAYHVAPLNLLGDGIHNFIDGLVIAGSYAVNISVGMAATISIIFHEIPQEIADFGVLLYSGMSKKRALFFNFFSAIIALLGVVIGILLVGKLDGFSEFVIPFAAGNFLYIAASNLLPQLHRHCKFGESVLHVLAIILGVAIVLLVTLLVPGHLH